MGQGAPVPLRMSVRDLLIFLQPGVGESLSSFTAWCVCVWGGSPSPFMAWCGGSPEILYGLVWRGTPVPLCPVVGGSPVPLLPVPTVFITPGSLRIPELGGELYVSNKTDWTGLASSCLPESWVFTRDLRTNRERIARRITRTMQTTEPCNSTIHALPSARGRRSWRQQDSTSDPLGGVAALSVLFGKTTTTMTDC